MLENTQKLENFKNTCSVLSNMHVYVLHTYKTDLIFFEYDVMQCSLHLFEVDLTCKWENWGLWKLSELHTVAEWPSKA